MFWKCSSLSSWQWRLRCHKYFIVRTKANIIVRSIRLCSAGCSINVNGDLSEPQPLLIKPGTAAFVYPEDKTGIIYLDDKQEIELYCSSGLNVPSSAGNSVQAKCIDGNLFEVDGISYSFSNFTCNSYPYHTTRKTTSRCFNDAIMIDIGFDLGERFLKVFEVCHDESTEETYFARYQLTPASEGFYRCFLSMKKIHLKFNLNSKAIRDRFPDRRSSLAATLTERTSTRCTHELYNGKLLPAWLDLSNALLSTLNRQAIFSWLGDILPLKLISSSELRFDLIKLSQGYEVFSWTFSQQRATFYFLNTGELFFFQLSKNSFSKCLFSQFPAPQVNQFRKLIRKNPNNFSLAVAEVQRFELVSVQKI